MSLLKEAQQIQFFSGQGGSNDYCNQFEQTPFILASLKTTPWTAVSDWRMKKKCKYSGWMLIPVCRKEKKALSVNTGLHYRTAICSILSFNQQRNPSSPNHLQSSLFPCQCNHLLSQNVWVWFIIWFFSEWIFVACSCTNSLIATPL